MTNELPAEIAEARDRHDTAISNLAMAETAAEAAEAELFAATEKAAAASQSRDDADGAEVVARREYITTLRRHGYVQTADGPRPGAEGVDFITVTPSPEMRAAVLAAAGLEDLAPKDDQ